MSENLSFKELVFSSQRAINSLDSKAEPPTLPKTKVSQREFNPNYSQMVSLSKDNLYEFKNEASQQEKFNELSRVHANAFNSPIDRTLLNAKQDYQDNYIAPQGFNPEIKEGNKFGSGSVDTEKSPSSQFKAENFSGMKAGMDLGTTDPYKESREAFTPSATGTGATYDTFNTDGKYRGGEALSSMRQKMDEAFKTDSKFVTEHFISPGKEALYELAKEGKDYLNDLLSQYSGGMKLLETLSIEQFSSHVKKFIDSGTGPKFNDVLEGLDILTYKTKPYELNHPITKYKQSMGAKPSTTKIKDTAIETLKERNSFFGGDFFSNKFDILLDNEEYILGIGATKVNIPMMSKTTEEIKLLGRKVKRVASGIKHDKKGELKIRLDASITYLNEFNARANHHNNQFGGKLETQYLREIGTSFFKDSKHLSTIYVKAVNLDKRAGSRPNSKAIFKFEGVRFVGVSDISFARETMETSELTVKFIYRRLSLINVDPKDADEEKKDG